MRSIPTPTTAHQGPTGTRSVHFEDIPEALRLIGRAIERGCKEHYDARQRKAVHEGYVSTMFVEVMGPYETVAVEQQSRLVAFGQLDLREGRLRALFVDAVAQQRGLGQAFLAHLEQLAAQRGCVRLHGAMSLNAVSFYEQAGFRAYAGPERLLTLGVWVPVIRMEKELSRRPPG